MNSETDHEGTDWEGPEWGGKDPEDLAILHALDSLTSSEPVSPPEEVEEDLLREYTETLALLPYELESEEPRDGVLAGILAQVGGEGVAARQLEDNPLAPSFDDDFASDSASVHAFPAPPASGGGWKVATWAMAAMIGACVLGLSFLTGQLREREQTVARLQQELQTVNPADQQEMRNVRNELTTVRGRLDMITQVARQAYPMKTVSQVGSQVSGVVYVCGAHQQWYLNLRGLESPPPGKEYQIWFMTDDGEVPGGPLPMAGNSTVELQAPTMPPGTHGFAVTLEDAGPHTQPEGDMVLLGEKPFVI